MIGDPGDPAKGHDLPGARSEAVAVVNLLRSDAINVEIEVEARIGAPSAADITGLLENLGDGRAKLFIIHRLLALRRERAALFKQGSYTAFVEGWGLYADGLISSDELQNFDEIPALIVANACLSGLVSRRRRRR